jgi:uroporphyrinogen-III synthase
MVQKTKTLKGKTIAISRPREQAEEAGRLIVQKGGNPYFVPTIEIKGPCNLSAIKDFVEALAEKKVDYVIFMSVNGAQHLLEAAENLGLKDNLKSCLNSVSTMAVGPKTAEALEKNHVHVRIVPEKYTSDGILQTLRERGVSGKTIYIPRTSQAPPELAEKLRQMGNRVTEIYVYESKLPTDQKLNEKFLTDLSEGRINAIIFSSSLGAKNLVAMLKGSIAAKQLLDLIKTKTVVVAIGPTTAKTLIDMGLKVDVIPEKHLFEEALNALATYWSSN